jgi:hypothetical protein
MLYINTFIIRSSNSFQKEIDICQKRRYVVFFSSNLFNRRELISILKTFPHR